MSKDNLTVDEVWEPITVDFRKGRLAGRSYSVDPRQLSRESLRRVIEVGVRTLLADSILLEVEPATMLEGVKRNA